MNNYSDQDFRIPAIVTPLTNQRAVVSTTTATPTAFAASSSSTCFITEDDNARQNPKKKRSKLIRIDDPVAPNRVSRPKYEKKPDPSAPKITKPCSECGKKFWSWKALFGHMRCHPERQWRGIDPPPNLRRPVSPQPPSRTVSEMELAIMGEADHEAASSLLLLAASGSANEMTTTTTTQSVSTSTLHGVHEVVDASGNNGRFECSSCKKVFGSHQALGGHRASHKNVKGCFAITKSDGDVDQDQHHQNTDGDGDDVMMENNNNMVMLLGGGGGGHKCNICLRVFSSGQALGGHMRCHWDKDDEILQLGFNQQQMPGDGIAKELLGHSNHNTGGGGLGLNLNLPAAAAGAASHIGDDQSSSYSSSGFTLDLRLGL